MIRILPILAFLIFASVPMVIGSAETKEGAKEAGKDSKESASKESVKDASKDAKNEHAAEAKPEGPARRLSSECLASEEVIQDLELREKKLKDKETAIQEKEKELAAQATAIKDEMAKLEATRGEISGAHAKQMADREEKVNKLMETFESMSPKAAAGVLNEVDDELAVTTLSKLTSVKAGKILSNLKPEKSSRLSELMAFGKVSPGKEKARAEASERTPASKR